MRTEIGLIILLRLSGIYGSGSSFVTALAHCEPITDNPLTVFCTVHNNSEVIVVSMYVVCAEYWTSHYWVAGTDYKTYSILRTCLGGDNEHRKY
jgi:hypothetical protein